MTMWNPGEAYVTNVRDDDEILTFERVDTFNRYWQAVMPIGKTTSMAYPFFYLKSVIRGVRS